METGVELTEADKVDQTLREANLAHPKGLYVCFFTEMWERFSFYGLKALLIFYLTDHFLFSDLEAANIFGNYFALVYALPLVGGGWRIGIWVVSER